MKKTAVLIYESFCNFEFSVALEILSLSEKNITIFSRTLDSVKSEEGLRVIPDESIDNINLDEYDSLLLPGAMDIRDAIEDEKIIEFIRSFEGKIIGAISIAPILLVKAGLINGKPFMAGINKDELYEEGFSPVDLDKMVGWDDNIANPIEDGYIITDKIITSVSYNFIKWALAFSKMVGLDISPKTFGI
ncbi:MAG: DJ-1/PfpI family protein [Filifactoraceae bacterium]